MLSYLKSECWRIATSKGVYLLTFALAALALAANLLLFAMNHLEADFPYGTARFSLSNLIAMIFLVMLFAGVLAFLLYADDRKNGTTKNTLAAGLSRTQVFFGKCLTSSCFGLASALVILLIYIGSAVVLLDGPASEAVAVLLLGIVAVLPASVAAIVLTIASLHFIQNSYWAATFWMVVLFVVPTLIFSLGLYFEPLALLAGWLPGSIFLNEVGEVSMSSFDCLWQTGSGMLRCLLAGIISGAIFFGFGLWCSRRMEF